MCRREIRHPTLPRDETARRGWGPSRFADRIDAKLELEGYGEGAVLVAGLLRKIEQADDAVGVFGGDGEWSFAADGVADVRVEEAVVAGDGRVRLAREFDGLGLLGGDGERPPGGFGFGKPGLLRAELRRASATEERGFLRI